MKKTKKTFFKNYLENKLKLETYQLVGILLLVMVFSGFVGWLWEFLFGFVTGGFQKIYITGGNLLPWINLYAYGGLLIVLLTHRLRRYPWLVFLVSAISTGLLELCAGWIVFTFRNGARFWDYSDIWWGIGNINGFVCPASITVFGLGGLLMMYVLLPFCVNLSIKMTKKQFLTLAISLFVLVVLDDMINFTLECLNLPSAMDFYYSLGIEYK